MTFEIEDRVNRNEARDVVGGEVRGIQYNSDIDEDEYLIAYDEGGSGWWPASALSPESVS